MICAVHADEIEGLYKQGKLFLEKSGQDNVDSAVSAVEALQHINSTSYETIISYSWCPDIERIGFLKIISAEFPDIPMQIFTRSVREDAVIEAFGTSDYLFGIKDIDIHSCREQEETCKQPLYRFSDIINSVSDATRVINPNRKGIASNTAIEDMIGDNYDQ